MNLNNACVSIERHESPVARRCGGVWLLAEVLPEVLAKYEVSDGQEEKVERRKEKLLCGVGG